MKRWIIPALVGWAFAALFGPREFLGLFRKG